MAGSPDLVVRVSANISALQEGMTKASGEIKKVEGAAVQATRPMTDLHGAFRSFDGVLASVGIHLGPEIRGLGELGDVAGKTATQVGLLGTAGLALGAALGGWKIGKLIDEQIGWSDQIAKGTAAMLGWGDAIEQAAMAQQDVLSKASLIAKHSITDLSVAMRIIADDTKKHTAELKGQIEVETARINAIADNAATEQDILKQKTDREEVYAKFHMDTMKLAADHEREWAAESKRILDIRNQSVIDGFDAIKAATQSLQDFEDQSWMTETQFQIKQIWKVADEQIRAFKGTEEQRAQFNSAILTLASAQADALYAKDSEFAEKTKEKFEEVVVAATEAARVSAGVLSMAVAQAYGPEYAASLTRAAQVPGSLLGLGTGPMMQGAAPIFDARPLSMRAAGGPVSGGQSYIVGERGPELYTPGANGFITPNGGGAGAPIIHIHVTQPLGTPQQIADVVGPALMTKWRGQGNRSWSGA